MREFFDKIEVAEGTRSKPHKKLAHKGLSAWGPEKQRNDFLHNISRMGKKSEVHSSLGVVAFLLHAPKKSSASNVEGFSTKFQRNRPNCWRQNVESTHVKRSDPEKDSNSTFPRNRSVSAMECISSGSTLLYLDWKLKLISPRKNVCLYYSRRKHYPINVLGSCFTECLALISVKRRFLH